MVLGVALLSDPFIGRTTSCTGWATHFIASWLASAQTMVPAQVLKVQSSKYKLYAHSVKCPNSEPLLNLLWN